MPSSRWLWVGAGVTILALAWRDRAGDSGASPSADAPDPNPFRGSSDPRDIMAAARMIASENPSASDDAKAEQIHAKLRATKPGQSLYDYATGGHGWGPQGTDKDKHWRPVSTKRDPSAADIELAKLVLSGQRPSRLPGARTFFDPGEQDRVYAQVEQGKRDLAEGKPITPRTQELIDLKYRKSAEEVREGWRRGHQRYVGTIGPVEFWT